MPRKAKDEIIEISKEVTEKKTPVKKEAKTTTKKENAKKATATASKTEKAVKKSTKTTAKTTTKKAAAETKTNKKSNTATAKKEASTTKKSTAKKTANKEVEETVKKTTRKTKSVPTEEKEESKEAKKTTRKTSTTSSKAKTTTKKSTSTAKKSESKAKDSKTAKKSSTTAKKPTKKSNTRKTKKTVADLENDVVLENAENEATEKVNVVEYYDLPYRYNQTVVKILAQTPNVLFVYWDISDDDRNNFVSQYGENFFNNTVPVLLVINKTMNYSYEVQINDFANSWYLHVNDANCEYQVELGRRNKEVYQNYYPHYYYVTTSNELDMPNDHILLENIPNNVLFKNVKTQELVEKPIVNISFFKDFAKSKDFYKYFKELLNDELEGDGINLNLPSSHTSSSFK